MVVEGSRRTGRRPWPPTSTRSLQPSRPPPPLTLPSIQHDETLMDTSGYDLKAWQAYYENQGYDMATSSTYAAYAMQQAAAAAYAPAASSSSSTAAAYGVRPSPYLRALGAIPFAELWADPALRPPRPPLCLQYPTQAGYTPAPAGWDSDPNQQLPYGSVAGAPGQPEPTEGASKFTGKRTTVIRKGGGKMWDE